MAAATDLLSPTFAFTRIGLNARFEEIDRQRLEPTEAQRFLLDHFEFATRARVAGCAGSGKTLIAMEKARRLARAGLDVLFLCFNRPLALWVANAMNDGSFPPERVRVRHFHGLADDACAAAGIPLFPDAGAPDWDIVPARMEAALQRSPMKFDALVVDEGQDFKAAWWLLLFAELLRRPDEDPVYVFYDANQRIYTDEISLPVDLPTYPLRQNLRNTKQIFEEVVRYYQGEPLPICAGPDGVEVTRLEGATVRGVQQSLNELVNEQRVSTADIIVLTGRGSERSDLKEGMRCGNVALTWHPPKKGEVQVSTVHAFKGLEKPVVVLTELDGYFRDPARTDLGESLLYVGASRATHHLVLVGADLPARGN